LREVVDNRKADILQIKKYLEGKLDAKAMHQLERRALDDPFLMDALQGYDQAEDDQEGNLADLSSRLQQRVDAKVRRMIPWVPISVAASILAVLGAGLWLFTNNNQPVEKQNRVAAEIKPTAKEPALSVPAPVLSQGDTLKANLKPNQYTNSYNKKIPVNANRQPVISEDKNAQASALSSSSGYLAEASPAASKPAPTLEEKQVARLYKDSVGLNEMIVSDFKAKKKIDTLKGNAMVYKSAPKSTADQVLQGKVDGVTTTPANTHGIPQKTFNGIVIAKNDGQPIIGAVVKVVGSTHGVVTDANGKFTLPNVSDKQTVTVNSLGYTTKQVEANSGDSLNIALDPNNSSLAEVAVVNTNKSNNSEATYEDARPKDGWKAFDKYLEKNAVSTDGQTGKVKVSFTVDAKGNLSNFKVIKSLSKIADQKAIDLIQYGPAWFGRTDRQPFEVKVSVKFH